MLSTGVVCLVPYSSSFADMQGTVGCDVDLLRGLHRVEGPGGYTGYKDMAFSLI